MIFAHQSVAMSCIRSGKGGIKECIRELLLKINFLLFEGMKLLLPELADSLSVVVIDRDDHADEEDTMTPRR